jgi:translation initiation factor 3 subunit M
VEAWVVKAVTAGLVDGKMNQSTSQVTFSRSVQREFTSVQWKQLSGKMGVWVKQVDSMLKAIGAGGSA